MSQRMSGRRTRSSQPTEAPTGRLRKRRIATSTGKSSFTAEGATLVEERLGKDPGGADFNPRYCQARSRNHKEQCGRLPLKGQKTCAMHGRGNPLRVKRGEIPSPSAKGRASQAVQATRALLKKGMPVTLDPFVDHLDVFTAERERVATEKERFGLEQDAVDLTAIKNMILHGEIELEAPAAVRAMLALVNEKTNVLAKKHAMEVRDFVPGERVRDILRSMIDIIREFVPEEHLENVAKKLRLLAPSAVIEQAS